MLDAEALALVRQIRARALARGDLAVVRECDLTLERYPLEDALPAPIEQAIPARTRRRTRGGE